MIDYLRPLRLGEVALCHHAAGPFDVVVLQPHIISVKKEEEDSTMYTIEGVDEGEAVFTLTTKDGLHYNAYAIQIIENKIAPS